MLVGRTLLALSLASIAACTGSVEDGSPGDAGADAGSVDRDAGAGTDGAPPPTDAGPIPPDSGPADAFMPPTGPDVDRTDPMLHEHLLDPVALDPTVSDNIEDQYAQLDTRAEPLGKLVFFLSGSTNVPRSWRDHGRLLAAMGFHVVLPHYNNRWSAEGPGCSGMGSDCNENTRWEALTGEDVSPVITASRADSAEGRVVTMLQHLVTAHPGGDWGWYLDATGNLRYEDVIIAGISHGASSTGLFATRRPFWRAAMHSGGWGRADTPMTPIDRWYGLSHTDDSQHAGHLSSWASAGMLGSPESIDGATAPFGGAHQLITSEANSYPHCSVVVHSSSPTDAGGNYLFEPAWRHMYGVAELL